jgi:hypothetical protein
LVEVPLEQPEMAHQEIVTAPNIAEPWHEPLRPQQLCFHF